MREFLKGLELDQETIDTIMAEVGKGYTQLREQIEELKDQVKDYESKTSDYENQIGNLNNTIEENNKSLENLQNLTKENTDLKADLQLSSSNVKKEFSKFVRSEIMANVNEENDFASVLENYKNDNPQFFGESVITKVQSSPSLGGGQKPQSSNEIMNDIIRSSK